MSDTRVDRPLFYATVILVALGIVAVCSASYPRAADEAGRFAAMWRQLSWAGIGFLALIVALYLPPELLRSPRLVAGFGLFVLALLVVVLLPGLGTSHGRGTARWLMLGPISVQPSELAKLALCLALALYCAELRDRLRQRGTLLPILVAVGLVCWLVLKQPHLGATMVIAAGSLVVLFVAGARWQHLGLVVLLGGLLASWSLVRHPYQMARVTAWLHPELADPSDDAYQSLHCATALARGGLFGRGPGHSIEKFDYLPECYTDSILAVVGEELGFLGTLAILALFGTVAQRGLYISASLGRYHDWFGGYLAAGLTTMIFLQAMLNVWVTTGLMPQTGVGLPFISYGGSALCCFLFEVGLLLNLGRQVLPRDARQRQHWKGARR